ncbi:CCR4-NOT transcription complex subunit 1 isoform X1 [Amborella trichopoda]|uniref:CCR4-NOT transcription complex subunit 1 isoform X1 n=1 Tax=Amborella trichopoda TaxID=13333 RepID=UPI0009BE8F80|nr:CCR4-NOT transcription complex subunit 1 isoform X1 [Amborella trichopoda]|eukprot:XP_020519676.1 CCR4-NOT transcription complex subunit 1 isoform X1 [Amborella trichopoda]
MCIMIPFASTVISLISFLINDLNESNYESVLNELIQLVDYGLDSSILLLQICFNQVTFNEGDNRTMQLKLNLFSAVFTYLLGKPNFSTIFCESVRNINMNETFLGDLSRALHLSISEKIGIGLALSDSDDPDIRMRGQNFCISEIKELSLNTIAGVSYNQIQDIIVFLYQSEDLSKYVDGFIQMLHLLQLKEKAPSVLTPMLMDNFREIDPLRDLDSFYESTDNDFDAVLAEIQEELSMADVMKELGYGCTINGSHCKDILALFSPLNEVRIARIISTIARTRTGLEDNQGAYSTFCSAIGNNSTTDSSWLSSWNVDVLLDAIKQLAPEINWSSVMENLDHEGFYLPDQEAFSFLMSIYSSACQDPFPLHAICGSVWKNAEGQLSFLRYAVSVPSEIFTFAHSKRLLAYKEASNKIPNVGANQAWICLDLLEVLCELAERGHASTVRALLEYPTKHFPEILLAGLAQINTTYNLLQYELFSCVFPTMIGSDQNSVSIHYLWHLNPSLTLRGFMDVHRRDPNMIPRILGICQEMKILQTVLDRTLFPFSIELAVSAARKEYMSLEKWLNENLSAFKDTFFEACLKFLKERIPYDAASDVPANPFQHSEATSTVSPEISAIFFKVLQTYAGQLSSRQLADELKRLLATTTRVNPRLQSGGVADSSSSEGFPDDVEKEANSYFHQLYTGQLSLDSMVQMLAQFKESSVKREQVIFDCMIQNLFDEYRFFPRYPERELKITAVLFGSLIKHQLVSHLTLGMALRCVLDALRKSLDSKMFSFGLKALEQFTDRLVEWPQYCNHILQISHLRDSHADLVEFIERALARISSSQSDLGGGNSAPTDHQSPVPQVTQENNEASEASWHLGSGPQISSPLQLQQRHQGFLDDRHKSPISSVNYPKPLLPSSGQPAAISSHIDIAISQRKPTGVQASPTVPPQQPASGPTPLLSSPGFPRPSRVTSAAGFGAALNIETLVAAAERREVPIEAPASEVQDKILFMINNISAANMEAKSNEFTDVLDEKYYPWFAQYMVMKRASIEPNFHDLYLKFLDKVNSKALNKEIVKATYENCKVLLRSELIKSSSEERSLLKNLGSWLGKFTIGRNQALRAKEIDPKVLIIEAYEKGLMIAVIPFTSKILEPCQSSLAYQPPNPWTMGILSLLSEIYALPNLKMNLKFDIEVLFKNLGVDMKDVKPTSLLKDRVREIEGNPDFSNKDLGVSQQPQVVSDLNTGIIASLSSVDLQSEAVTSSHPGSHSSVVTQYTAPLHLAPSGLGEDDKLSTLGLPERIPSCQALTHVSPAQTPFPVSQLSMPTQNIGTYIVVNPKLNALGLQLQFQRIVPVALEQAVRDITSPVVERSVTIACMTTRELVLKDYALEADESRIHNSANMMAGCLAGSLAHVTCKEPLRIAMSNKLRVLLQPYVTTELLEQAVQLVTNDNLDLGCVIIEQTAVEKALRELDDIFVHALNLRRKLGYEANNYSQGALARLPEALRPKSGRLSAAQQRVYEDFTRLPMQSHASQSTHATPAGPPPASSGGSAGIVVSRVYTGPLNSNIYSPAQVPAGFTTIGQPMDHISEEMEVGSAQSPSLPSPHVVQMDGVVHQGGEISGIAPSLSMTPLANDVHPIESSTVVKESGAVVPPSPLPLSLSTERIGASISEPLRSMGDALEKYHIVSKKLETLVSKDSGDVEIQGAINEVPEIILRCISRDECALAIAQKVFRGLYENTSNSLHVQSHLAILVAIRDVCKLVVKELTSWVIYSDDERKFNKDITVGLMRSELISLAEYDMHLAKLIDSGRNKGATDFAVDLVKTLVVPESGVGVSELHNLFDALVKLSMRPGSPESLQQLVETARNPPSNVVAQPAFASGKDDKARQSRDKKVTSGRVVASREDSNAGSADTGASDPPGFREQVGALLAEWARNCEAPGMNDATYATYISQLQQSGMLKGDDVTDRFFRVLTELAVAHCLASESHQASQSVLSFAAIDMYAKLVVLLVKYAAVDQGLNKFIIFPKVLAVTVRVIQKDADEKKASFHPRPYFRLFIKWIMEFNTPDSVLDTMNFQVLTALANAFHVLQPMKVPGFSYAWLELISHRFYMPKLLMSNSQKGWPLVQRLLVDLFKFLEPSLRNAELGEAMRVLYKGTLRVLLVLLHDFPEFLCNYHFSFCDVIPYTCIQMRNVILSAFPRHMRLPDPCLPNLKVDLLPEICNLPVILSEVDAALKVKQMKAELDEYLKSRQPGSPFLTELKQRLLVTTSEAAITGCRYNIPLINSLVLYVGMQEIQQLQSKSTVCTPNYNSAYMDIFEKLTVDLDTEGRYLFLNAVANQLRYPNNHTHYFSCVILYLFAEASQEIIQEQITRVLMERLIVSRPHPWGLLITFIELLKNPRYNFWSHPFIKIAPEIERVFDSVARSCFVPQNKAMDDGIMPGALPEANR